MPRIYRSTISMLLAAAAVVLTVVAEPTSAQPDVFVEPAFPNLDFRRPVDFQNAGDGSNRLFVVEQSGRIMVFDNDASTGTVEVFLDIEDRVDDSGNEEGLLGLAFDPDYTQNGYFFVYYTATGNRCLGASTSGCSKVTRFSISAGDPNEADVGSETLIIQIDQPFSNHNGGQIRFGSDGFLYIAVGDGGSGGDPAGHGQNGTTLLGSILRIDVDPAIGQPYGIPADNPFVGTPFRDEIYAYGLRNPWRFSFDAETGDLWAGDVGQSSFEEIDIIVRGGNYGWNVMEGAQCFSPPSDCNRDGLELPVWTYSRSSGRSVTGGFVYRGEDMPDLVGVYVYADFVSGRLWGLTPTGDGFSNRLFQETGLSISAFGVDEAGELYLCSFDGSIYRVKTASSSGSNVELPSNPRVEHHSYPNPVTHNATIVFTLGQAGTTSIDLFDVLGDRVASSPPLRLEPGEHRHSFSTDGLAAGMYFYRIATGAGAAAGKIVVL